MELISAASLSGVLIMAAISCVTANMVQNSEGDFIINGVNAGSSEFPHMALLKKNNHFTCGGSLVADNIVLTAKHCIRGSFPSSFRVEMAIHNRDRATNFARGYRVIRFISHPSSFVDIALLVLERRVWINSYTKEVDLSTTPPADQEDVTIAGFGWTVSNGGSTSTARILQKVVLPVQPAAKCYSDGVTLAYGEFCAGIDSDTYTNSCHGDSGGPVQVWRNNKWVQVGVVVRGVGGCPTAANYAAFVNASYIYDWVSEQITFNPPTVATTTRRTTAPPAPPPRAEPGGCFTHDSLVETPVGPKPVSDLETGDMIRSLSSDGHLTWSPMLMNIHADSETTMDFLYISTEAQTTPIKITPNHLMFKSVPTGKQDVFAADVKVGDELLVADTNTGKARAAKVTSVTRETRKGIYAPLTEMGTVVVDGVAVSCYATLTSHAAAHTGFAPVRWLYFLFHVKAGDFTLGEGVHWYPALLESVLVGTIF